MPYEYGHYFAWGETERKEVYEWSTYKYSEDNKMTKYCNISDDGYEGFTDNLTILESGDDAATVNWGSGWRTPTKEQWEELIDNTNGAWTTQNEVYGRVFYGNGQSIFLPAAGDRDHGSYWSSSLDTNYPIRSWYFHFSSRYFEMSYDGIRLYGFSVRPVRAN